MDLLYDMAKVLVLHWIIQLCKVKQRNRSLPIRIQKISPPYCKSARAHPEMFLIEIKKYSFILLYYFFLVIY